MTQHMGADHIHLAGAGLTSGALDAGDLIKRLKNRYGDKDAANPSCEPDLWIAFFFDGTQNNVENDKGDFKHTNVARLYRAHVKDDEVNHVSSLYLSGVGTKCKNELTGEIDKGGTGGLAIGSGGEMRLRYAMDFLKQRLKVAESKSSTGFIHKTHVAIFGFSRGAALARAFAIRLAKGCHEIPGLGTVCDMTSHPHRFSIYFMGIFDTVAAVGRPTSARSNSGLVGLLKKGGTAAFVTLMPLQVLGANVAMETADGHDDWASDLRIPPRPFVERCLHLVAAHEVRLSFPLDLVMEGQRLPSHCAEFIYPGVHSDVGGGYGPGEQGRGEILGKKGEGQKLSQIPLYHMFTAAREAGVPLRNPGQKEGSRAWEEQNENDFKLDAETVKLFNTYLSSLATKPGATSTLQAWIEAHMGAYFQWRATVLDQPPPVDQTKNNEADRKKFTAGTRTLNEDFKKDTEEAGKLVREGDAKAKQYPYIRLLGDARETYVMNRATSRDGISSLNEDTRRFFQTMVHDSAVAFVWDGTRISNPRVCYVGGNDRAWIA